MAENENMSESAAAKSNNAIPATWPPTSCSLAAAAAPARHPVTLTISEILRLGQH
jgi:hypothetical protein